MASPWPRTDLDRHMLKWQTIRRSFLDRHVHAEPYAALVLSGGYEEAGDDGRFQVGAGNVVFHDSFHAHLNRLCIQGATVLNVPLAAAINLFPAGLARVEDPDVIARTAEKSDLIAADQLISLVKRCSVRYADWPDELAASMVHCPSLKLSEWGEAKGLAPWTLSRGFAQVFRISPEAFRSRARTRRALRSIQHTAAPLASIAAELGFADQAHMSRSVKELSGVPPQALRSTANRFKTARQRGH